MRKRILVVQGEIPHYRKPVFGALAKYYDITVVHSGPKSVGQNDTYRELINPVSKVGPFFLQRGILNAVRSQDYDVAILMCDVRWLANVAAVLIRPEKRLLYWGHRYSKLTIINWIREFVLKRSDGVVQYSDVESDRMISHGIPPEKIFVAQNTIHLPNHSDESKCEKDSFLFVGRAQKRKRVDRLIHAFAQAVERMPENTKIGIVGAGEENANLRSIAERVGVANRVVFHGEIIDTERLKELFSRAYAYVSPGPVGLGIVHSLGYGVPVVTNYVGKHGPEFKYLENGKNAVLYDSFDELRETLVCLCTDKNLAAGLGANAYESYLQQATFERMMAGLIDAIEGNVNASELPCQRAA